MDDRASNDAAAADLDPRVGLRGNERADRGNYSGQEYDSHDKASPRYVAVAGEHGGKAVDPDAPNRAEGEQIPSEAGRRAYVDEKTGEVHGSGAGAGGGSPNEDYDHSAGGGGEVRATQRPGG
jgi:hypothetical protein